MVDRPKMHRTVKVLAVFLLLSGAAKFYHYNYIEHTRGQAWTLKDSGLEELVCKGAPYTRTGVDQCGKRSIYGESDWGVTAYMTIYGVESREEAEAIAKFMVEASKRNGRANIPINLKVYSVPRSAGGNGPVSRKHIIFDQDL